MPFTAFNVDMTDMDIRQVACTLRGNHVIDPDVHTVPAVNWRIGVFICKHCGLSDAGYTFESERFRYLTRIWDAQQHTKH